MGVVLYEVLAQREPFRGRNIDETFANIKQLTPPPPSEVAQHLSVPAGLDKICLRAIEKKASDRYQGMMQMINEIRSFRGEAMLSS